MFCRCWLLEGRRLCCIDHVCIALKMGRWYPAFKQLIHRDPDTTKERGIKGQVLKKLDIPIENASQNWAGPNTKSRLLVIVKRFFPLTHFLPTFPSQL